MLFICVINNTFSKNHKNYLLSSVMNKKTKTQTIEIMGFFLEQTVKELLSNEKFSSKVIDLKC